MNICEVKKFPYQELAIPCKLFNQLRNPVDIAIYLFFEKIFYKKIQDKYDFYIDSFLSWQSKMKITTDQAIDTLSFLITNGFLPKGN